MHIHMHPSLFENKSVKTLLMIMSKYFLDRIQTLSIKYLLLSLLQYIYYIFVTSYYAHIDDVCRHTDTYRVWYGF